MEKSEGRTNKQTKRTRLLLQGVALALVFVFAVALAQRAAESTLITDLVSRFGYLGLFVVSFVSGFNVVVPVPVIAFLPVFLASGLSFWLVLLVMSVGMSAGDVAGFLLGQTARDALAEKEYTGPFARQILFFGKQHKLIGYGILFLYATFAPIPNELLVVPMAFLGYRLHFVFPIILVGNFIFNVLIAYGVLELVGAL